MTTWTQYLADIREDLKDPSGTRWTDAELLRYTNDGIYDYSTHFPKESELSITPVAEQKEYDFATYGPSDILYPVKDSIVKVEHPDGNFLHISWFKPGDSRGVVTELYGNQYVQTGSFVILFNDKFILTDNPDTNYSIKVWYLAHHSTLSQGSDSLSIPAQDESLLMWYVTARAFARIAGQDAMLARWEERSSRRTDWGPVLPEHQWRMQQYLDGIARRKKPEVKRMHRFRRRR